MYAVHLGPEPRKVYADERFDHTHDGEHYERDADRDLRFVVRDRRVDRGVCIGQISEKQKHRDFGARCDHELYVDLPCVRYLRFV